jgi:ABC-type amino acid transport substrate-binding protein
MPDTAKPSGIDVDILSEYLIWLKTNKQESFQLKIFWVSPGKKPEEVLKDGNEFSIVAGGQSTVNATSKETDVSVPYLKNISFCITNGNAPDVKTKTPADIVKGLGAMKGLTVPQTILEKSMQELKKMYLNDLTIENVQDQTEILNQISRNVLVFGYVDAIEFWYYLKNNPTRFLKIQKALDQNKANYVFIFKKNSPHKKWFQEFMNAFKATPRYKIILEKNIGGFMAQTLSVK